MAHVLPPQSPVDGSHCSSPPFPRYLAPISPVKLCNINMSNPNDFELPIPVTCKVVDRTGSKMFRCAAAAMNGFRSRMEDAHVCHYGPHYGIFGVFDGHAGDKCSAYFATNIAKSIEQLGIPSSDVALENVFLNMDAEFIRHHAHGGSTAAVVIPYEVTHGNAKKITAGDIMVKVAHVGDSRVLIGNGDTLKFATVDHKPSIESERMRIETHGGFVKCDRVDGRLAMSRALGDAEFKVGSTNPRDQKVISLPTISTLRCSVNDFIIIACDGVFETMTNEEVISFVALQMKYTNDTGRIVAKLLDRALSTGSTDNTTAMIVQMKNGTRFNLPTEYVPGPYIPRDTMEFKHAYSETVRKAGISMDVALHMRMVQLLDQLCAIEALQRSDNNLSDVVNEVRIVKNEAGWDSNVVQDAFGKQIATRVSPEQLKLLKMLIVDLLSGQIDVESFLSDLLIAYKTSSMGTPKKQPTRYSMSVNPQFSKTMTMPSVHSPTPNTSNLLSSSNIPFFMTFNQGKSSSLSGQRKPALFRSLLQQPPTNQTVIVRDSHTPSMESGGRKASSAITSRPSTSKKWK